LETLNGTLGPNWAPQSVLSRYERNPKRSELGPPPKDAMSRGSHRHQHPPPTHNRNMGGGCGAEPTGIAKKKPTQQKK